MKPGSVLVDIAIDQGGCFEDSRPTTHAEPTFQVHNSVFYCVANMPGAVPNTSTYALTNATLPYIVELANRGWVEALRRDPALAKGLNTHDGKVVYGPVAEAHGLEQRRTRARCSADWPRQRADVNAHARHVAGPCPASVRTGRVVRRRCPHFAPRAQLASNVTLQPFRAPVKRRRATLVAPLTEGCSVADTSCRVRRIVLLRTADTP